MRRVLQAATLVTVMALIAVPASTAQQTLQNPDVSTPTTLYFHIFDTFNKFVINTQPMDADFFEVGGSSIPTFSGTPANNEQTGDYDLNTIYGTSTAGPVEYDFTENGRPRFHPEAGIAADVRLDEQVQPIVYMYIDVRDFLSSDGFTGGLPNVLPSYTFRATMREGDDPGDNADLDQGRAIMHGETTVHIVDSQAGGANEAGDDAPPADHPYAFADEDGIVEIQIPMTFDQGTIPKAEAFNIRLDWYQLEDVFGEDAFAEGYMRLTADQDHLPRMEFAIRNPVFIDFIHPQVAAGTLLIHTGVNSPWGTYDVDVKGIKASIEGPSTPSSLVPVISQNAHVHGLHDQSAEVTYLWKFRDDNAAEGEYTIHYSVPNVAGTATATGTAKFIIEGEQAYGISDQGEVVESTQTDDEVETPLLGAWAPLAVLALAAIAARRRSA